MTKLSPPIISRLSEYLLILEHLDEQRQQSISSKRLAEIFGNKPSQIRQDILYINSISDNYRQGYNIKNLIVGIREALGLADDFKNVIIIGAGRLGQAIGKNVPFESYGMSLVGLFDINTHKDSPNNLQIYHIDKLEEVIKEKNVSIVALCTPEVVAQGIVNRLTNTQVVSILNYSRMRLKVPSSIIVRDQQMICSFMQLCYEVEYKQTKKEE